MFHLFNQIMLQVYQSCKQKAIRTYVCLILFGILFTIISCNCSGNENNYAIDDSLRTIPSLELSSNKARLQGLEKKFEVLLKNKEKTSVNLGDYTLKITLKEEGGVGSMLHYKDSLNIQQRSFKVDKILTYFCNQKELKMENPAIVFPFVLSHPAGVKKVTITIHLKHKDKKENVPPIIIVAEELSLITDEMIQKALNFKNKFGAEDKLNSLAKVLTKLQEDGVIENNTVDEVTDKDTVLSEAVKLSDVEILKLLLDQQILIDQRNNQGDTPLHYAVEAGNIEMVKLLIEKSHKDQLNQESPRIAYYTPLREAIHGGHIEIAKLLIEKLDKEQLSQRNSQGDYTILHFMDDQKLELAKLLLDKLDKDQINLQDYGGNTPLHYAAGSGYIEFAKLLLDELDKDQINQQNFVGTTPLHYAAQSNAIEIVKALLNKGADKTIKNNQGQIPRDLTTAPEIKDLL